MYFFSAARKSTKKRRRRLGSSSLRLPFSRYVIAGGRPPQPCAAVCRDFRVNTVKTQYSRLRSNKSAVSLSLRSEYLISVLRGRLQRVAGAGSRGLVQEAPSTCPKRGMDAAIKGKCARSPPRGLGRRPDLFSLSSLLQLLGKLVIEQDGGRFDFTLGEDALIRV